MSSKEVRSAALWASNTVLLGSAFTFWLGTEAKADVDKLEMSAVSKAYSQFYDNMTPEYVDPPGIKEATDKKNEDYNLSLKLAAAGLIGEIAIFAAYVISLPGSTPTDTAIPTQRAPSEAPEEPTVYPPLKIVA